MQRKLYPLTGGGLRLELIVTIRVLRSTWLAKYSFDLEPVSVERIDVLESKLRDQQDELEKLRGEMRDGIASSVVQLKTTQKNNDSVMQWEATTGVEFVSNGVDGVVKAQRGGTYIILVTVASVPGSNTFVQLLKNKTSIQAACPGYAQGYRSSVSLNTVAQLDKDDELMVTCQCSLADSSYLSIVRLGN